MIAQGGGNDNVDYIPGLSSTNRADLPTMFHGEGRKVLHRFLEAISAVNKAQYLLFTSIYELEEEAMNAVKAKLHIPIYPIGPMIPYFKLKSNGIRDNYLKWLDSQPVDSVLYISQGSYHSFPCAQMDEIVAGIIQSGVRFLRVTRDVINDGVCGSGYLVNWCNQLKVLSHPCIGGFLTHCGWNSTCEGIYAGVPMLTGPLWWDQVPNSKLVVSDWKIGLRLFNNETLVTRHEIAHIVRKFMDPKCDEQKEMVNKVKMLQEICRNSIAKGGSAASNLQHFITNMFPM